MPTRPYMGASSAARRLASISSWSVTASASRPTPLACSKRSSTGSRPSYAATNARVAQPTAGGALGGQGKDAPVRPVLTENKPVAGPGVRPEGRPSVPETDRATRPYSPSGTRISLRISVFGLWGCPSAWISSYTWVSSAETRPSEFSRCQPAPARGLVASR